MRHSARTSPQRTSAPSKPANSGFRLLVAAAKWTAIGVFASFAFIVGAFGLNPLLAPKPMPAAAAIAPQPEPAAAPSKKSKRAATAAAPPETYEPDVPQTTSDDAGEGDDGSVHQLIHDPEAKAAAAAQAQASPPSDTFDAGPDQWAAPADAPAPDSGDSAPLVGDTTNDG